MMGWWFVLAVFLYFVSAGLIFAEVLVRSGGLMGMCALGCLIGGIAIFFNQSIGIGWIGVCVALVEMAVVILIAYKIFPKTKFGKNVTSSSLEHKADKD
jgi:membrane-bound ClpP family serine protease